MEGVIAIKVLTNNLLAVSYTNGLLRIIQVSNFSVLIETNLLDVLRNDWQSPENQQVALMTFDALFKLTEQCPENTYKEGTKYQENFMNKGGLEQLECL